MSNKYAGMAQGMRSLRQVSDQKYERERQAGIDAQLAKQREQQLALGGHQLRGIEETQAAQQALGGYSQEAFEGGITDPTGLADYVGGRAAKSGSYQQNIMSPDYINKQIEAHPDTLKSAQMTRDMKTLSTIQQITADYIKTHGQNPPKEVFDQLHSQLPEWLQGVNLSPTPGKEESTITHKDDDGKTIGHWVKDPNSPSGYRFVPPASTPGAASAATQARTTEVKVSHDPATGSDLFQRMQFNPDTMRYDIPIGEPYSKGQASQVAALTDDAVHDLAVTGIVDPSKARVTGGRSSALQNQLVENRRADIRREIGMDEGDTITRPAEFRSLSASLLQQDKSIGAMGSFLENLELQVDRYNQLADDLFTFDTRILNVPINAARTKLLGSPLKTKLDTLIVEISNEIGKISTGSTASVRELSISAQQKWEEIHDKNLSIEDMKSVLEEIKHLADIRRQSVYNQRSRTVGEMRSLVSGDETTTPEGEKPSLEDIFK